MALKIMIVKNYTFILLIPGLEFLTTVSQSETEGRGIDLIMETQQVKET